MTPSYIALGVVAAFVLYAVFLYNRFVTLGKRAEEAWADIDVQLKRRYDLIPNLVETVKGYASHERKTLEDVTEMRTRAMNASAPRQRAEAENMLAGALKSLFAVSENYPDLKANQNFLELQRELSDTENKLQAARRFYNANVRDFNTKIEVFPNNLIAGKMHFAKYEFFEIPDAAQREVVQVKF